MTQSDKARVERIRHSAKECYPVSFTAKDVLFLLSLLDKQQEALMLQTAELLELRESRDIDSQCIIRLEDALAKSEKRAEAAIADLKELSNRSGLCYGCKYSQDNDELEGRCLHPKSWLRCEENGHYEWNDPTKEEST